MRKLLQVVFLSFIIFILSACACKQVSWNITRVSINPQVSYEIQGNELIIKDESLKLRLILTPMTAGFFSNDIDHISCIIENQGSKSIKVIFDESSIVSHEGKTYRAIRGKVRLINLGKPQPPLVIPPQAAIDEDFFGAEEIEVIFTELGAVKIHPSLAKNEAGQSVRLLLVVKADRRYEIYVTLRAY